MPRTLASRSSSERWHRPVLRGRCELQPSQQSWGFRWVWGMPSREALCHAQRAVGSVCGFVEKSWVCPPCPQALYLSWVVEARRNILAILQDMPSLRPPIDHLCELLPRLQARYYSIASSSKVSTQHKGC